jgi:hypothetical protein
MIRRIMDFVLILIFVWACMIMGLWVIDSLIVPLVDTVLISALKIIFSALLVLFWLWIWREIVKMMFWRVLNRGRSLERDK